MAGFLYYAVGESTVRLERIHKWGLAYALPERLSKRPANANHPSGRSGVVFCDPTRVNKTAVDPEAQRWRKMPARDGRPELWLGYWLAEKPTAADLARDEMLPGLRVRLGPEGDWWQIPTVRDYDNEARRWRSELPAMLDYDDQGNLVDGAPLEAYRHLWDLTTPIAEAMLRQDLGLDETEPLTDEELGAAALALLRANYRVDVPELVQLGELVRGQSLGLVVTAACRKGQLLAWLETLEKKSDQPAPIGCDITAGPAD